MRLPFFLLLCASLTLSPRSLKAITFIGGFQGNIWTDYRNWSPQQVPGSGDEAVVPENKSVTVNGAITVGSLVLSGGLNSDGNPNSSLTIVASFSWLSGGVGVPITLLQGGAGLWQGNLGLGADITNYGAVSCNATVNFSYHSILNYGEFDVAGPHTFNVIYSPASFENHGLLKKPAIDAGTFSIGILIVNHPDGDISVENGELYASIHCQNYGHTDVSLSGIFHTHTLEIYNTTTFTGNGEVKITGNGLYANNTSPVTFDNAETSLNANGFIGSGSLIFPHHLTGLSGSIQTPMTITSTGSMNIDGPGVGISNNNCVNNGQLNIHSNLTFSNGKLTNYGTISLTGPYTIGIYAASAGIFNHGTVIKPAAFPDVFTFGIPLHNEAGSHFFIQNGILHLTSDLYNAAEVVVSAGALLRVFNTHIYNGATFTGGGTYRIEGNGVFANNTAPVSMDIATVEMTSNVGGTGALSFSGHLIMTNGGFSTAVTLTSTCMTDMNAGNIGIGGGVTTNYGTLNINAHFTLSAGILVNYGLILLNGPYGIGIYYGTNGVFNHGTVKKPASSPGIYNFSVPLTNYADGNIIVENGELHNPSNFYNYGHIHLFAGTEFESNNYFVYNGASYTGAGLLKIQGNALNANNTSNVSFEVAEIEWNTSLLGSGPLTFSGHILWKNANLNCPITMATGAVLDLATAGAHGIGATLTNNGTLNADCPFYGNGTLNNAGILHLHATGDYNISIANSGILNKNTAASGDVTFNRPFTNSGTVHVFNDVLHFNDGLSNSGALTAEAGAEISLEGYGASSLENGSSVIGDGVFRINATLNVQADLTLDIQHIVVAGALDGTGVLTFPHQMTWSYGFLNNTLILTNTAVADITGMLQITGTLVNHGTVNCAADVPFSSTGNIVNHGTFHLTGDYTLGGNSPYYPAGMFDNAGLLDKTSTGTTRLHLELNNLPGGMLSVQEGTLQVTRLDNEGTANIAADAILTIQGGTNFASGLVAGNGLLRTELSGWHLTNTLTINSFSLEIAGDLSGDAGATLEINGGASWLGGDISLPVHIASSGIFATEGYGSRYLSAALTNDGTFHSNGNWYTDADVTNNGSLFIGSNGGFSNFSNKTFTNTSTGVVKFLANYGVYFYMQTINNGLLELLDATVYFNGDLENHASIIVPSGSTLSLGGLSSFNPGTSLNANGQLVVTHSLALQVAVVFSGEKFTLAGDLSGSGGLTINSLMNWENGSIETDLHISTDAILHIGYDGGGGGSKQAPGSQQQASSSNASGPTLRATITNHGTIHQYDAYNMDGGTLTNNGLLSTQYSGIYNGGNGGILTNNGTWEVNSEFECQINATNNGTLSGNGTLTFEPELNNNGTVSPGFSPGQLHFTHNYQNGSDLIMEMENSAGPGSGHDYIEANNQLLLSGALTIAETGSPIQGAYTLLRCNGGAGCRTGEFSSTSLPSGYTLSYTGESVVLTKGTPASISPADTSICSGNPVTLTASEGISYHWNTGETTQSIQVYPYNENNDYFVTVTYADGSSALGSALVHVTQAPYAYIYPGYTYLCQGESATLVAYSSEGTYLWSTGETTQEITVSPTTSETYTVTVSSSNGCSTVASATVEGTTNPASTPLISGVPSSICQNDPILYLPYYQDGYYGSWSGPGIQNGYYFNPAGLSGYQTLTFTPYPGQCALAASWIIEVGSTWYADADSDGYGNAAVTLTACTQPSGYVANHNDCNDANAAVHPGAIEICDGIDNDCNNFTDQADPNVVDNTPPTISCPANQTVAASNNCNGTVGNWNLMSKTDNCATSSAISESQTPAGSTILSGHNDAKTVTLNASDGNGNSASCSFTVTLKDVMAPVLICPANRTVNLNVNCQASLANYISLSTVSDNCTAPTAITRTQSPATGTTLNGVGLTVVTITATDAVGNMTTCTFHVLRADVIVPTITCPASRTLELGAGCMATLPDYTSLASASDNCTAAADLLKTQVSPTPGSTVSGLGTTIVTLRATDASGKTKTCTFNVSRVDSTAPYCGNAPQHDAGLEDRQAVEYPAGLEQDSQSLRLEIFPNPTDRLAQLVLHGLQGTAELSVFDPVGSTVWQQTVSPELNTFTLDFSEKRFANGLYFVTIRTGKTAVTKRLVVNKSVSGN